MNLPLTLSERQQVARATFDIDAAIEALPGDSTGTTRGNAGVRLKARHIANIGDALLREFACGELGALRCSTQYLDALRIVLGNQAHSERYGYRLEMNQRVYFASPRAMRTIIDQMQAAGITSGAAVGLGSGRSQVVQCFHSRMPCYRGGLKSPGMTVPKTAPEPTILEEWVPY